MVVGTLGFANLYAKRLYDDLLSNYNRLIRPVNNSTDKLTVWLNLKLSQLIEVVIKLQFRLFYWIFWELQLQFIFTL